MNETRQNADGTTREVTQCHDCHEYKVIELMLWTDDEPRCPWCQKREDARNGLTTPVNFWQNTTPEEINALRNHYKRPSDNQD